MNNNLERLQASEDYKKLVETRSKIMWPLAILMFAVYYGFIMVIAFTPDVFAVPIGEGHTTLGIVVGLGVIIFSFIVTGIYVHKANTVLEPLTDKLHKKMEG